MHNHHHHRYDDDWLLVSWPLTANTIFILINRITSNICAVQQKGQSDSSLQAQSTGEDSNSSDTALSDRAGPVTPKTEPTDYPMLDDHPLLNSNGGGTGPGGGSMMDQARTFPGALLGLQGKWNKGPAGGGIGGPP